MVGRAVLDWLKAGFLLTGFALVALDKLASDSPSSILPSMLHHNAFLLLSDNTRVSAATCQHAIRIFAEWDLSVPRLLLPGELDKRFGWSLGTAQRTLNALDDLGILVALSHGRLSSGAHTMWMISQDYAWSPRSLCEQWGRQELARERASVAHSALPDT